MKLQLRKTAFLPFVISLLMVSCSAEAPSSSGSDSGKAVDAIKEFYSTYIFESSKMPLNSEKIESLKKSHCTASFLTQLSDAELEEDPFLNAQDVDESWASTLEVAAKGGSGDLYSVCYVIGFDNSKHCVEVTAKEVQGQWKIDNVKY